MMIDSSQMSTIPPSSRRQSSLNWLLPNATHVDPEINFRTVFEKATDTTTGKKRKRDGDYTERDLLEFTQYIEDSYPHTTRNAGHIQEQLDLPERKKMIVKLELFNDKQPICPRRKKRDQFDMLKKALDLDPCTTILDTLRGAVSHFRPALDVVTTLRKKVKVDRHKTSTKDKCRSRRERLKRAQKNYLINVLRKIHTFGPNGGSEYDVLEVVIDKIQRAKKERIQ